MRQISQCEPTHLLLRHGYARLPDVHVKAAWGWLSIQKVAHSSPRPATRDGQRSEIERSPEARHIDAEIHVE